MESEEITIRVSPEAASAYREASAEKRRSLDALLSVWLQQAARPTRSLDEIMHDASEQAQRNGLTMDRLQEILDADD
jgi:hypothetical protein